MTADDQIEIVEDTDEYICFRLPKGRIWECAHCEAPLYIDEICDCQDGKSADDD